MRAFEPEMPRLSPGAHAEGSGEMCVMEAASVAAGQAWTDRPASVSPVIAELLRGLNDCMADAERQRLIGLVPMLPGTRGDGEVEATRSWMVMDWHSRTWPSTWLRAIGCRDEAAALAGASAVFGTETLRAALPALGAARAAAAAQREAAWRGALAERAAGAEYRIAVAAGKAQVGAVRAMSTTSGWNAGWDLARAAAPEWWDRAAEDATSTGRDAALVCAWNGVLHARVAELQDSLIG